jgi:outer membrane biosynthesis protein TonB
MPMPRVDKSFVISAAAHAAVLLWAAVSFAAKPLNSHPTDAVFVETMTFTDFSEMMAGSKTAPKKETPKKLVEKIAEPKPVENHDAKVSDKTEVVAAAAPAASAKAEPKPEPKLEPKPEPKREVKPEPRKEPEKKQPDAEALKKNDKPKKEEPKKEEAKPLPPKKPEPTKVAEHKPVQEQSKFDASRIAALLDKRQPQRLAAAGDVLNSTPALGTPTGNAPKLSQNEIDALRARIQQCWNPPAGAAEAKDLIVQVRIMFNKDGSLSGEPRLVGRVAAGYQQVAAESALRAIRRCAPYSFMPIAKYDAWKDVEVTFDPRDLFRG